jgi:hemerythrin superfamily protein
LCNCKIITPKKELIDMDALELLKIDHDQVGQLFDQIEQADSTNEKRRLFQDLKQQLDTHAYIEENVFYPYFEDNEEMSELIEDSFDDHQEMRDLIQEIELLSDSVDASNLEDSDWDDRFDDLMECVEDHVSMEEEELFPRVESSMSSNDLMNLGARLEEAKRTFMTQSEAA